MGDNWFTRGAAELDPSRSVGKFFTKIDPTTVKKADTSQVQATAGRVGQLGEQFANKQVPLYTPGAITAQKINPAVVQQGQGWGDLQNAVGTARGNVEQAGVMDPRIASYLAAAQQQGQYSPQAFSMMQQAAMGQGPSAAQAQLQAGIDQSIQAQMTAAASRGFSPAAMRGAQMQGAQMQQAAANQAAQLRAQEQQAAQQAFLQGALQQEQMARTSALQAGATTLEADAAGKQAKQNAINTFVQGSGTMAGLGQERAITQAQIDQQTRIQNQQAILQALIEEEKLKFGAAGLQQQGQIDYSQLAAGLFGQQLGAYSGLAGLEQQRYSQSAKARSELIGGLISGGSSMGASALSGAGAAGGAGGAAAAAPVAAAAASDRNMKKDIKVNKETQAFLNALTDNEYSYRDTTQAGTAPGKQYGPMAQDLAKTKMGKTAVIDGPDGMMVDSSRGFLLALSGLANINQRLNKLGV
jgi:hypothetical protein